MTWHALLYGGPGDGAVVDLDAEADPPRTVRRYGATYALAACDDPSRRALYLPTRRPA